MAPMSSPPLLPPSIASLDGLVKLERTRNSAQAAKSSNTFCFLVRLPAVCHSSPNSPPPPDVGHYINPAAIEPNPAREIKIWRQADAVTAITVKKRRILSVLFDTFFTNDIEWNLR